MRSTRSASVNVLAAVRAMARPHHVRVDTGASNVALSINVATVLAWFSTAYPVYEQWVCAQVERYWTPKERPPLTSRIAVKYGSTANGTKLRFSGEGWS